jgi:hypothetical protein
MPKRIVIALCVVLIFFVGWAFGQEHQLNAAGWADMGTTDSLAGLMYVKGYTEGYCDGHIKMVLISQTKNSPAQAAVTQFLQLETTRAEDLAGFGHALKESR